MVEHIISCNNLSLVYKNAKIPAINDLSFTVTSGEIFGLLGPNGAGKTTVLKVLSTLLYPTTGNVTVNGHDVVRDSALIRQEIGVALQTEFPFFQRLTINENLRYFASLCGVNQDVVKDRVNNVLEQVGLYDIKEKRFALCSWGMRQRLMLAKALLPKPKILVLDEPWLALDLESREQFNYLLRRICKEEQKTVLISSHEINIIEEICDRILVMHKGYHKLTGSPEELKRKADKTTIIEVSFYSTPNLKLIKFLEPFVSSLFIKENTCIFSLNDFESFMYEFTNIISAKDVKRIKVRPYSLEDIYKATFHSPEELT